MRRPADDARRRKNRRVERDGNAHHIVNRRCREVHIREEVLLAQHHALHRLLDLVDIHPPRPLGDLAHIVFQDDRTDVTRFVFAVSKAHNPRFLGEFFQHPRFGAFGRADVENRFHRGFVRAAVQRAAQRTNRPHHRRIDVRQGGGNHPRREGGGVIAMFCVEDEGEIHHARVEGIWLTVKQHIEEVRGVP
jgi:hypothetical protein